MDYTVSEPGINSEKFPNNIGEHVKGLTMFTACVFIVGEMSGTGVLSLPKAMFQAGWAGLAMILFCCLVSAYCGIRLSSCWMLILRKNDSVRQGARDPFPVIAYEACGKFGRILVLAVSYIQLFGVGVIFLLIAAQNFREVFDSFWLYFCDWTVAITILMIPVAMFGTPKDFWPIAVGAMLCTAVACLLIFIQTLIQIPSTPSSNSTIFPIANQTNTTTDPDITFMSFFESFGTILFCFGGAVMFPTIQADMSKPEHFPKSVIFAYIIMLVFYLPVAVSAYVVFTGGVPENIIKQLDKGWMTTSIIILITGHLLTAFNIILNPVYQGIELVFKAPNQFCLKRVVIRTGVLIAVLFVAQSIPHFGPILSFIGGSTVSLSSFILPCLFYVQLCRKEQYYKKISGIEFVVIIVCMLISVFGGAASTWSSLSSLFSPDTFVKPCYLDREQS